MRLFSSSGQRLRSLPVEAKLVYSFFALFSLLGIASSILLYEDMVGWSPRGVRAYYTGEAAPPPASPGGALRGPAIALPDEPPAPTVAVAQTYRKLLEVTHFHLFTVPVFLLIVAHLFMLGGLGPRAKIAWIVAAWLAALAHLAAPWVVRYGLASGSWLYGVSGAAFAITSLVLTVHPLAGMWLGGGPRVEASGD